jgi:integrase
MLKNMARFSEKAGGWDSPSSFPPIDGRGVDPQGHLQVTGGRGRRRWRAFWVDADGKHSRVLGPAWVTDSGKRTPRGAIVWHAADGSKPHPAYLTPKEAQIELRRLLEHDAERRPIDSLPNGEPSTFAEAAEAWYEHGERKRDLKRTTLKGYRQILDAYLLPADEGQATSSRFRRAPFGGMPLRRIGPAQVTAWYDGLPYGRTTERLLVITRSIFTHARRQGWMDHDPTSKIVARPVRYSGDYDFYSREEVDALVRAAASEQDAAIYLTAAMTGLRRGELVALRWRDIDFAGEAIRVRANYSYGELVTPKSGKVRSVPMIAEVALALAGLAQRELFCGDQDPVFVGAAGGHLDATALRRRYVEATKHAGLRPLPLHSLRHYFGSMAVNRASLVQVQAWMGHSHIQTTARYLHAKSHADDAKLLARAFAPVTAASIVDAAQAST